ncbi:hypothetical protein L1987_54860 [Smallanthus sonchifolius]|uniref:Uncharacterized protein n=1 Tax=Smallanthus sonchifolius TaxID=185202 RepID=A0ACB9E9C9_9ASTR|nr:hypothetical protein L1987_54860 [Smallanthus sonchifolius]
MGLQSVVNIHSQECAKRVQVAYCSFHSNYEESRANDIKIDEEDADAMMCNKREATLERRRIREYAFNHRMKTCPSPLLWPCPSPLIWPCPSPLDDLGVLVLLEYHHRHHQPWAAHRWCVAGSLRCHTSFVMGLERAVDSINLLWGSRSRNRMHFAFRCERYEARVLSKTMLHLIANMVRVADGRSPSAVVCSSFPINNSTLFFVRGVRMSSLKESVGGVDTPTDDPFELRGEESVELTEEARDTVDENLDDEENGSKRKGKSDAWSHFITVEMKMHGKMVKKHQCIHCQQKGSNRKCHFSKEKPTIDDISKVEVEDTESSQCDGVIMGPEVLESHAVYKSRTVDVL